MLDLERDLNERQLAAVTHARGPLLVVAGAGSGKTRVITYRIANLAENHGVDPRRIMSVTFTNKAAREMKERVERLLGRGADAWVSTFHAGCARLLRWHGEAFGVNPRFTIYDDQDQKAMVARVLKDLSLDDRRYQPRTVQNELNRAKRELVGPEDYPSTDAYRERIAEVYRAYEERMRSASALDFADLLYRAVKGMAADPDLAAAIRGRFDHLQVDEFQDTNRVQLELVRLLAADHGNVCVVGDDDQSIYSWRGADVRNILEFERHFPGAREITLDRNYRSTSNILSAAHRVVVALSGRRSKELWTDAPDGDRVALIEAQDEREEALWVVRAVRDLAGEGVPLSEQAVFYRVNAQSRVLEEALRAAGVAHRVVGGMRFYERAEVKDVIAYMRLALNPGDLSAFLRIVNTPARGLGKSTVDRLVALAAGRGISAYDAIPFAAEGGIGAAAVRRLGSFRDMVEGWRADLGEGPSHLARRALEDTGYLDRLEREDTAEADARIENLRELAGSVEDFEKEAEAPTVEAFLELIALQTDVDATEFDGEQLTLMTVHSAKGLEFDAVFVTGLEDGLFPYRAADEGLLRAVEQLEEERRLCYVAMTRARRRLFLTHARQRRLFGATRYDPPSRFLGDLSPDVVEDLSPRSFEVAPLGAGPGARGSGRGRAQARPVGPGRAAGKEVWLDRNCDQTADRPTLEAGRLVRHARFGVGTVIAVVPGDRVKVEVRFPGYGRKVIVLDYLEPA